MEILKGIFHSSSTPKTPSMPQTPSRLAPPGSVPSTPSKTYAQQQLTQQPVTLRPEDMPANPADMQKALDEALACELYMQQFKAIHTKQTIAKEDEETAFGLQLGNDEDFKRGRELYKRYPSLDAIKGDDAFLPASAVLGAPSRSVPQTPNTPQTSSVLQTPTSVSQTPYTPQTPQTPNPVRDQMRAAGLVVKRTDASALYGANIPHNTVAKAPVPPTPATPQHFDHWESFAREREERALKPPTETTPLLTQSQPPSIPATQVETHTTPGTPTSVIPYTITETITSTPLPTPPTSAAKN